MRSADAKAFMDGEPGIGLARAQRFSRPARSWARSGPRCTRSPSSESPAGYRGAGPGRVDGDDDRDPPAIAVVVGTDRHVA
ncbi:MAG: hypothetical protein OJJ54_22435, partial [Pseudonocardia sp.]|nr:hypothetical protein [Pseudonocardia sp.]